MRVYEFRRTLKEFSRQARHVGMISNQAEGSALATLAEQLESRIGNAQIRNEIKSEDTISSAPGSCPCCGRS